MLLYSGRSSLAALVELLAANNSFGSADWLEFTLVLFGGAAQHIGAVGIPASPGCAAGSAGSWRSGPLPSRRMPGGR